jgi:ABC-type multidrug transport system ATPase subunit/peptidoglycan/LPS O-acetylase OafA/YrhL
MHATDRLHALDAVRGFALLLGIVFHAGFSFLPGMIPGIWAMVDVSPSTTIAVALFASHIFRMSLFFFMAGFFGRMMFHRKGSRGFLRDRLKRILVPLVVGWIVIFPSLAAVWVWGITKTFGGAPPALPANLPPPPPGAFPLTHLWFLYYLLIIYAIAVAGRGVIAALDRSGRLRRGADVVVDRMVRSGAGALLLGAPIAVALYFHANWIAWFGIPTPDQSLVPQIPSLVAYGTAFAFGWLVQRQVDLLQVWRQQWPGHLAVAIVATSTCLLLVGATPLLAPASPGLKTFGYALSYTVAIWSWVFAITGFALRFLSRESRVRRYIADASYWLYLVHLPVVAAFQVLVGHLPWHWAIKFPLILVASFAILFASYHAFVRFTFIGGLLNGRRYVRGPRPQSATTATVPGSWLAELEGAHKRYGEVVALAGVDLRVGRGELVALLGPNGAGKSTAISLLLGLLETDRGEARLLGQSPLDVVPRRSVGVMIQEVALPPALRVREHIALACSYYPDPLSIVDVMALTGTTPLANRRYGSLSAGQKRQVQFGIAICGRPRLLFLDEPSVGLDVQARERMWQAIRALVESGTSIVLTTHYLEEAEALADRVVVLTNGRVAASGTVDDVRAVVGRKRITCATAVSVDEVRAWPGVIDAARDAHRLHITVTDAVAVVRQLLDSDRGLTDLEVRPARLSEAFAELTKEAA